LFARELLAEPCFGAPPRFFGYGFVEAIIASMGIMPV